MEPVSQKLSIAVRIGLADCLPARAPLAQLELFLIDLRESGALSTDEIAFVDRWIRWALARVAAGEKVG